MNEYTEQFTKDLEKEKKQHKGKVVARDEGQVI
jgi:hypothetical protein